MDLEDHLLDDNINIKLKLVAASKGKRLANLLIDMIAFYIIIALIAVAIFSSFESLTFFDELNWFAEQVISSLMIITFYTVLEGSLNGKSIGKFISKTRVVNIDGTQPNLKSYFLRSCSRIVPFEGFSFLGDRPDGWHDRWTDTMVMLSEFYTD